MRRVGGGEDNRTAGARLVDELSRRLTSEFGSGFSRSNVFGFRQFYVAFPPQDGSAAIVRALRGQLTWTHYRLLIRVEDSVARTWYMNEAADQSWSTRTLDRQIHSLYYERLLISRDSHPVRTEAVVQSAESPVRPADFIRDPVIPHQESDRGI